MTVCSNPDPSPSPPLCLSIKYPPCSNPDPSPSPPLCLSIKYPPCSNPDPSPSPPLCLSAVYHASSSTDSPINREQLQSVDVCLKQKIFFPKLFWGTVYPITILFLLPKIKNIFCKIVLGYSVPHNNFIFAPQNKKYLDV